jgi:alpha-methylacyl-CoA racemase
MMLADHGADVLRITRPGALADRADTLGRSRRTIALDLKNSEDVATARMLVCAADGLIEGYRPRTMERLGLGPDVLLGENPRLIYGRMTGWGQTGPYAPYAGHDLNYASLSGALHAIGRAGQRPTPPPAMIADFGGGGMLLAFAMVAAILNARGTGQGQVVDCAMTEGTGLLMTAIYGLYGAGDWRDDRGCNLIDSGAHFYDSYETADGKYISIGAIEPQFYREMRELLDIADDPAFENQNDQSQWPALKERMIGIFKTRTRDEWCALLEHTDVCFAPVLGMADAPSHPHNVARGAFVELEGIAQPAPAPCYSGTPLDSPRPPAALDENELRQWLAAGRGRP